MLSKYELYSVACNLYSLYADFCHCGENKTKEVHNLLTFYVVRAQCDLLVPKETKIDNRIHMHAEMCIGPFIRHPQICQGMVFRVK